MVRALLIVATGCGPPWVCAPTGPPTMLTSNAAKHRERGTNFLIIRPLVGPPASVSARYRARPYAGGPDDEVSVRATGRVGKLHATRGALHRQVDLVPR